MKVEGDAVDGPAAEYEEAEGVYDGGCWLPGFCNGRAMVAGDTSRGLGAKSSIVQWGVVCRCREIVALCLWCINLIETKCLSYS